MRRLDRDYFEDLYAKSSDPWDFATSEYERRKYEQTLAVLEGRHFRRALEVGSSIGIFTALLAPFCDELISLDTSERAVAVARERLSDYEHVKIERRTIPEEMPEGPFDLIVASEVLYYLPPEVVLHTLRRFEEALEPGGVLLAVHWRKETRTYPMQGDEVHELLIENSKLTNIETIVEPEYRLNLFEDPS